MAEEIHVNDVGTVFEATIADSNGVVPLVTATTRQLLFQLPDGSVLTKTAAFTTDGTDGKMEYATEALFLSQAGVWQWQPYVVFAGGEWHADVQIFVVYPNLA